MHPLQLILEVRVAEIPTLIAMAEANGVQLCRHEIPDSTTVVLSFTDPAVGVEIHLMAMTFSWRLVEVIDQVTYGRHWCYFGTEVTSFLTAVMALKLWRGDPESEPRGFSKSWIPRLGGYR